MRYFIPVPLRKVKMTQATPTRSWWAAVFDLGPHAGAHWTALRASLAIFVPLVACLASGRGDLLLYAAIGAFAALYGRHEPARVRLAMQAQAGLVMVVGVVVGALVATVPFRLWLLVPVAAAWAGVAVVLAELGRWHPAGALNPVFALTASATVPIALSTVPGKSYLRRFSVAARSTFGWKRTKNTLTDAWECRARSAAPVTTMAWPKAS